MHPARTLVVAVAAVCAASGVTGGQQERVDFRADVELVLLHVAVIDPGGGDVPPLTAEDFTIYDDGARQQIELFLTPTDAPLDVGLILDSSASMRPVERVAHRAATTFLRKLDIDDCAYVLPFADVTHAGLWGRSADPDLHGFIDRIRSAGGTALYDAVLEGLAVLEGADSEELMARAAGGEDELQQPVNGATTKQGGEPEPPQQQDPPTTAAPPQPQQGVGPPVDLPPPKLPSLTRGVGEAIRDLDLHTPPPVRSCGDPLPTSSAANARRRALVVLSDGADEDSEATFYEALAAARAASVPVFAVALGYANEDPGSKARLAELARATGGRLIENVAPGRLSEAYAEVVTLLRSYYLIGYDPRSSPERSVASGRWHEVEVDLRRPNFEPLVRPGYYR